MQLPQFTVQAACFFWNMWCICAPWREGDNTAAPLSHQLAQDVQLHTLQFGDNTLLCVRMLSCPLMAHIMIAYWAEYDYVLDTVGNIKNVHNYFLKMLEMWFLICFNNDYRVT